MNIVQGTIASKFLRSSAYAAAGGAALLTLYLGIIRPWHLNWGASDEERNAPLPGDELIPAASFMATRGITIDATPAAVWPWLVQMGYRRAGWYSYDRFDNDGIHVNHIIPELQHLEVGDILRTDANDGFRVKAIDPERSLVLLIGGENGGAETAISAACVLKLLDGQHTRLLLRVRADFRGWRERLWGWLLFDFGDFVMMRKMLIGIKQRVERVIASSAPI